MDEQTPLPRKSAETIIVDQHGSTLAMVDAFLWPPLGAVVELADPNRDAIVRDVRMSLFSEQATVMVRVDDTGELQSRDGS